MDFATTRHHLLHPSCQQLRLGTLFYISRRNKKEKSNNLKLSKKFIKLPFRHLSVLVREFLAIRNEIQSEYGYLLVTGTVVHKAIRGGKNTHSTEYQHVPYEVRTIKNSFHKQICSLSPYLFSFLSLLFIKRDKGSKTDISVFISMHLYRIKT